MAWIDKGLEDFLRNSFKDRKVKGYYTSHTWQSSRYVLRQQAEISAFLTGGKLEWKAEQIDRRREKIVSFAVKRWDFDSLQI